MARAVIMVHDRISSDPYLDVGILKQGDFVTVMEDDHRWSEYELALPCFKFIDIPGARVSDLSAFLVQEPGDPVQNKMLRVRAFKVDIAQLPSKADALLLNDVLALKLAKPPLADPNVLTPI